MPNIDGRRWRKLAEELALDADDTIARIAALAARLPGELESVVNDMRARGLTHPVLDRLVVGLSLRIEACRRRLGA